jgi:ribulose bisphosphate carboxylase small subunit
MTSLVIILPSSLCGQLEVAMTIIALRIQSKGWNIGVEYEEVPHMAKIAGLIAAKHRNTCSH